MKKAVENVDKGFEDMCAYDSINYPMKCGKRPTSFCQHKNQPKVGGSSCQPMLELKV